MTTVYIDPIHGAALTAGLLPILPGLPCPTCGGRSEFRDDMFGSSPCPDCTDGVWTPPDHPVTIGVTSATADAMLDQDERMHEAGYDIGIIGDQRSGWELATRPPGEEWTSGNTIKHPIVLSSVIGEGTLRKFKVEARRENRLDAGQPHIVIGDTLTYRPSAVTPFVAERRHLLGSAVPPRPQARGHRVPARRVHRERGMHDGSQYARANVVQGERERLRQLYRDSFDMDDEYFPHQGMEDAAEAIVLAEEQIFGPRP
jgi:hypothetical protein